MSVIFHIPVTGFATRSNGFFIPARMTVFRRHLW